MRATPTLGWGLIFVVFAFLCLSLSANGETAATQPAFDAAAGQAAEVRMLRSQVQRQLKELADAKAEIAALKGRLLAVGINPDGSSAAGPESKPKRIIFVLGASNYPYTQPSEEIKGMLTQLTPDQWFNVIAPAMQGVQRVAAPFSKLCVQATPANVKKASEFATRGLVLSYSDVTLPAALQLRPEVVYFVGWKLDPGTFEEVKRLNLGLNARINTTIAQAPDSPMIRHDIWQLAHDTGGICVDANGDLIDEPVLPIKVERPAPPPPATKPSVFKLNR